MDTRFLILLAVWAILFVAFVVVEERAMKRLRGHRIDLRPRQSIYSGRRILTWQKYAYDPMSYDEEGKRILRQFRARMAVLFATWVGAGLIYGLLWG